MPTGSPYLVIHRDEGYGEVFPLKAGEAMARLLPGAAGKMRTISGASHMLQEDQGEQIADLILEWTAQ